MPFPLRSVLLVDDDATANFLHQLLLQKMGLTEHVVVATDGQQALAVLAAAIPPPALILLDVNMPVFNGFEFLVRYAAEYPALSPRPVVALLSSSEAALDLVRAHRLPVDAYLTKPLTRAQLHDLVRKHFAQQAD